MCCQANQPLYVNKEVIIYESNPLCVYKQKIISYALTRQSSLMCQQGNHSLSVGKENSPCQQNCYSLYVDKEVIPSVLTSKSFFRCCNTLAVSFIPCSFILKILH